MDFFSRRISPSECINLRIPKAKLLLPDPLSPTIPKVSPGAILKLTSFTALYFFRPPKNTCSYRIINNDIFNLNKRIVCSLLFLIIFSGSEKSFRV